jgi:hypothetical protein
MYAAHFGIPVTEQICQKSGLQSSPYLTELTRSDRSLTVVAACWFKSVEEERQRLERLRCNADVVKHYSNPHHHSSSCTLDISGIQIITPCDSDTSSRLTGARTIPE